MLEVKYEQKPKYYAVYNMYSIYIRIYICKRIELEIWDKQVEGTDLSSSKHSIYY